MIGTACASSGRSILSAPVLRAFLEAGTNPDVALPDDIDRPTPLLFTAMNTNALPSIRAVVEAGARLDILDVLDVNGRTPLSRALS